MNVRENFNAILHYQSWDKLPILSMTWWLECFDRWHNEGMPASIKHHGHDGNLWAVTDYFGFDHWWLNDLGIEVGLLPPFEEKILETRSDGGTVTRVATGEIVHNSPNNTSIPQGIDWTLKDRASWEAEYKWRLNPDDPKRLPDPQTVADAAKGNKERTIPIGLHVGSLYGILRNYVGFQGISYMLYDDIELVEEMVENCCQLVLRTVEVWLKSVEFDFVGFWEDISFKNGPIISPELFRKICVPRYKRITDLCRSYGVDVIMVDSDGKIDELVPCWLEGGVNCMFPIEVGTWNGNIKTWKDKYGKAVLGIGGVNKTEIAKGRKAIDAEIERLKPLVELGGYIPMPDHLIPPNVSLDNLKYYVEAMRKAFC